MKFSATFAVLAVFVAKACVSAAPMPSYETDALEARAEFVEAALEEVWERFYDELVDEVDAREYDEDLDEARDYDEDLSEARDFDDEEIFERTPMKKFATDLATNLAQKAPKMAQQYSQSEQSKHRQQHPRLTNVVQQAQAQAKGKPIPKPLPASSKWNTVKQPGVMAAIKAQGKPSIASQAKGAFGKKRSLDDIEEDLFVRAPMKKFATDLATNLAQKAPKMAQQYSQSEQSKHRQQHPRLASVVQQAQAQAKGKPISAPKPLPASSKWNNVKKPSVMDEIKKLGKKRSLDVDEDLFERAPMKKFATDLATNLAQKAPKMAQQYSQSEQSKHRQQHPRLASVVQQAQNQAKGKPVSIPKPLPASSKWNTVKKPSVMDEVKKLGKK